MTVVATIEARMTSSRLPGKVLMPASGKPLLGILIERLLAVPEVDRIVVATTVNAADDPIVETAAAFGAASFRGSEDDVLGRVAGALRAYDAEVAVEITGDCPLIDPEMVSACIAEYRRTQRESSYVGNTTGPSLGAPHGLDVQVFAAAALLAIADETSDLADREHVSLPFYRPENAARWKPRFIDFFPDDLCHRVWISLDYAEDYRLIRAAHEALSPGNPLFGAVPLIAYCQSQPEMTSACLRLRGWV